MTPQPTLTDGTVTLRAWRDDDARAEAEGHDDLARQWLGTRPSEPADERFAIEHDGQVVGSCELRRTAPGTAALSWRLFGGHRGRGHATRAIRVLADFALSEAGQGGLGLLRVEASVEPGNEAALRVATRSGLRREGVRRIAPGTGERAETTAYVILARLASDPPISDPTSFRTLLNSFLPRKRAISQMLLRDPGDRVLLCQLTYKQDWDLPGGVVEVGESPALAVAREVEEELGLAVPTGPLLLTDWLPPWGGWDDALCLVFDGGVHPASITDDIVKQAREIRSAEFCTLEQVHERAADFTARRIEAALTHVGGPPAYTESGR